MSYVTVAVNLDGDIAVSSTEFRFENFVDADDALAKLQASEELRRRFPPGSDVDIFSKFLLGVGAKLEDIDDNKKLYIYRYSHFRWIKFPSSLIPVPIRYDWVTTVRVDATLRAVERIEVSLFLTGP